jgi:hypothetical protein
MINAEGSVVTAGHCLGTGESQEIQEFVFSSLKASNPVWYDKLEVGVLFSDGATEEHFVKNILGEKFMSFLCCFHLETLDAPLKLGKLQNWAKLKSDIHSKIIGAKTATEFEANYENIIREYPASEQYLSTWLSKKHRFVDAWRLKVFTAGLRGTSISESLNARLQSWHSRSDATLLDVFETTLRLDENLIQMEKNARAKLLLQCFENDDLGTGGKLSKYVMQKYMEQLDLSKFCSVDGITVTWKNSYVIEMKENMAKCSCLLSTNAGYPCRHELAWYRQNNRPIFSLNYFNPRWVQDFTCSELPIFTQEHFSAIADDSVSAIAAVNAVSVVAAENAASDFAAENAVSDFAENISGVTENGVFPTVDGNIDDSSDDEDPNEERGNSSFLEPKRKLSPLQRSNSITTELRDLAHIASKKQSVYQSVFGILKCIKTKLLSNEELDLETMMSHQPATLNFFSISIKESTFQVRTVWSKRKNCRN